MVHTAVPPRAPTRMLAAELVRPGTLELRESAVPVPGPGELLVQVETALTCGTDLKTYQRGHPKISLPAPMGHEFSGVVAAVGSGVTAFHEGDAIACVPSAPCGDCRLCARGLESLCPRAADDLVLGAFAEFVRLPSRIVERHVFPRPAAMSAAVAAALEPLACVLHGVGRVSPELASTAVFLGDGPISLLFLQAAKRAGAGRVLVAGKHPGRLDVAGELGADAVVDVTRESLDEAARDFTAGHGADLVVECVGRPDVWETAMSLAGTGGEVLLFGGCPAGSTARFPTYRVHYEEVDVKGAFHYGHADVQHAFELLAFGAIQVEPLITHRRPLARLPEALELALSREALKVAIEPGGSG